jgi:D-apionolactonase
MTSLSQSILRYGADTPLPESLQLNAGLLSLEYAGGALRYIRLGEQDVLLQMYAAVRDHNWDTILPFITLVEQATQSDSFRLRFRAEHQRQDIHFVWDGTITGDANGTIIFQMNGEALSTFWRNRIGFCILHPMTCAGQPCLVETVDGTHIDGQFPLNISPHQPYKNIRALTHEIGSGLRAEVRMEGEIFEMEDQRNWTDASFKTYCTPLDVPFPVQVEAGTKIAQRITLKLLGDTSAYPVSNDGETNTIIVTIPNWDGSPLPRIGLGAASHGQWLTPMEIERLRALQLAHLRVDIRFADAHYETVLAQTSTEARALNIELEIALHLSDTAESELAALRRLLDDLKPPVSRWLIFKSGEKSTSRQWMQLARQALADYDPDALIGAGTDYFFTELNRFRPPVEVVECVSYSITPQVHAFDNAPLVEALKPQAVTVASSRTFVGHMPIAVSPVTLKIRINPNATVPDPDVPPGQLPPQVDTRQMSLFGAGWTLGSLKYLSESGVHSITYYETSGWRGVMETAQGSSLPDQFPSLPGAAFPLYHIFADVGEFADGEIIPALSSSNLAVEAMVLHRKGILCVLLANFTAQNKAVYLPELHGSMLIRWLDDTNVERAMHTPKNYRSQPMHEIRAGSDGLQLDLPPYAIARIQVDRTG